MSEKQMKNKEFIDYIVNERCKQLISEFVEDLENIQTNIDIKSFIDYCVAIDKLIEKWEEKL